MNEEIQALERNQTWFIVDLPPIKKPIGARWIYKLKHRVNDTIERYKARLVAKGYNQVEGYDYHDTYAPVAKLVTLRRLLAIVASKGWELHQLDANNAFLNGDLIEDVYMSTPPGFPKQPENKSTTGYSLFTSKKNGSFIMVLVYVDDLVITENDPSRIGELKLHLYECFSLKDLGLLKYFLSLEIMHNSSGIFVCQNKYALDIIVDTRMEDCKLASHPMVQQKHFVDNNSPLLDDPSQYRHLVGWLVYLMVTKPELCFQPELCFLVHILSQFLSKSHAKHVEAAKRVVRFVKANPSHGIFFPSNNEMLLQIYCDSDWASCPLTWRSTTGYVALLGSAIISWKTKKQTTVSHSSAKAEYRAMAVATDELLWFIRLLRDLDIPISGPMELFGDNRY
ncbi:PREDICTED: uncharacterized protein LOC109115551 [Nelumbo nucifera]|uniref:Uncharacterized protein LOC109115551 n=1 Tax=Nelumbo nucifera TaxID=4432 RepID=A0A1U8Q9N4_NELNU|nr:PREDICTED: uncharacterized protein LOC109115551 [Nelumbo nucifera]